ncbi:MAG TPA: glycosyltransferase family 39 protein [Thermomicrobiales bacterium]
MIEGLAAASAWGSASAPVVLLAGLRLLGPDGLILVATAAVIAGCAAWASRGRVESLLPETDAPPIPRPAPPPVVRSEPVPTPVIVGPEPPFAVSPLPATLLPAPVPVPVMPRPKARAFPLRWEMMLVAPAGLILLIVANHSLNDQDLTLVTLLMLVVGCALWIYDQRTNGGVFLPWSARNAQSLSIGSFQRRMLAVAIIAAGAAYAWSSDNTFRPFGVANWLLSVAAWSLAWWPRRFDPGAAERVPRAPFALSAKDVVLLAGLFAAIAAGAFFRFYRIDETPLDPTSDHAEKLLDVTDVLHGKRPIFFERNTGREPTQFYFTAAYLRITHLPTNFTTLKLGTAFIGTLAIPLVYLLATELAGRTTGLFAATLYAIGTWPVEIARAGLRFPYAPLATAAVLWFLLRWMRTRDRRDALLCGLGLGVGLYGYTPFRIVVLSVGLGLLLALVTSATTAQRRRVVGDGLLIGATAAVVFVPLGRYALEHREMFWYRAGGRLTGDNGGNAFAALVDHISVFLRNNWNAALGFNWRGDSTFVNAVTYAPMMDLVTGALFLAGLTVVLAQIAFRRDVRAVFLLAAFPLLLLSSTLAIAFPWENPSVNREGPAAPFAFTIAALPLAVLVRRLRAGLGSTRGYLVAAPAIAVLIGVAAVRGFDQYFHDFDRQTRASVPNTTEIAQAIRGAAVVGVSPDDAYVIDAPYWLDIRNIGIALGDIDWGPAHNVRVGDPLPTLSSSRPLLLILKGDDQTRLAEVERAFPWGHVTRYPTEVPSHAFVTVWVPAPTPFLP